MLSHMYEYDDAYQDCAIALLEAALRYDPSKGATFATYASWYLYSAIQKNWEERYAAHIPKNHLADLRLERKLSKIAEKTITLIKEVESLEDTAYIEEAAGEDDEILYEDLVEAPGNISPETVCFGADTCQAVFDVIRTLTLREQKVLILRFGLHGQPPKTLEDVGKIYGVTRERIRQIEAKALRKLRHPSRSRKLEVWDVPDNCCPDSIRDSYSRILSAECVNCMFCGGETGCQKNPGYTTAGGGCSEWEPLREEIFL